MSVNFKSRRYDTDGVPLMSLDHARFEADGKQVVVPSPATHGWNTWFCGAGDNLNPTPPSSGRGQGTPFRLTFTEAANQYFDAQFNEPVEMHDGEIYYTGTWTMDDYFELSSVLGPTVATSTPGEGNVQAVDMGGYSVYVPAAGNGSHTVDFENVYAAAPVPTGGNEYWTYNKSTGFLTPTPDGSGNCNIMNMAIEVYFMRKIPMGHGLGRFEIDTYKVEWLHPSWKLRFRCIKTSSGDGEVAAWIMLFRQGNT